MKATAQYPQVNIIDVMAKMWARHIMELAANGEKGPRDIDGVEEGAYADDDIDEYKGYKPKKKLSLRR